MRKIMHKMWSVTFTCIIVTSYMGNATSYIQYLRKRRREKNTHMHTVAEFHYSVRFGELHNHISMLFCDRNGSCMERPTYLSAFLIRGWWMAGCKIFNFSGVTSICWICWSYRIWQRTIHTVEKWMRGRHKEQKENKESCVTHIQMHVRYVCVCVC